MIETPCTGVCQINKATGRCKGCARTREQVAYWRSYTPEERRIIMKENEDAQLN